MVFAALTMCWAVLTRWPRMGWAANSLAGWAIRARAGHGLCLLWYGLAIALFAWLAMANAGDGLCFPCNGSATWLADHGFVACADSLSAGHKTFWQWDRLATISVAHRLVWSWTGWHGLGWCQADNHTYQSHWSGNEADKRQLWSFEQPVSSD
jgi:hypothetical protein